MFTLKDNTGRYFSGLLNDPWRTKQREARFYSRELVEVMSRVLGRRGLSTQIVSVS